MTAKEFIEKLNNLKPNVSNTNKYPKNAEDEWYFLLTSDDKNYHFIVEELNNKLEKTIGIENFLIYGREQYSYGSEFEEDGFYPFGFYLQDDLFIHLKTGRVEARDLVLTKYYDVAKNEQKFLEAFLIFAKHYAQSFYETDDIKRYYLGMTIEECKDVCDSVVKIVGGEKYRPFWKVIFQAWTDEELKEMG